MQPWQMHAAKARFSEVVKSAADDGPQAITVHGRSVAVVVSPELFDQLSGNQVSLIDFMRQSPLYGSDDIEFERNRGLPREVDLPNYFVGRVHGIDAHTADRWGRLMAQAGRPLPVVDTLLAATALQHDLTLVTRNMNDFAGLEVRLINPWEG